MNSRLFLLTILVCGYFSYYSPATAQTSGTVQFNVTGNISTRPDQIQLEVTSPDVPMDGTISQEQTVSFTLELGSTSTLNTIITIKLNYTALTPDGSQQQLLDYVVGSAGSLNGADGVIDPQQHTITWQNVNIPANTTGLKLPFQLKSNSRFHYTDQDVPITISASITQPFITPTRTFPLKYRYNPDLVPPTPTPTPIPPPKQLAIKTVEPITTVREVLVAQLNSQAITIEVAANPNSNLKLTYGNTPKQLSRAINSISRTGLHRFKITSLRPNTAYYFQLLSPQPAGAKKTSDVYVFRTPTQEEALELNNLYRLTASNAQGMIFSGQLFTVQNATPVILLPRSSKLTFDLRYDPSILLSSSQILLYQTDLGAPITAAGSSSNSGSKIIATVPGQNSLSKYLNIPDFLGNFTLKTRIQTQKGSISEATVANIQVIKPIIIRHQRTGAPIADAKVTIYKYNQAENTFLPYPNPEQLPLELYSGSDGSVPFIPQDGRFRLQVDRTPFHSKAVDLRITLSPTMVLPDIELRSSIIGWFEPFARFVGDFQLSSNGKNQNLQEWLNELSEIIIGKSLFSTDNEELVTTNSF